MPSVGARGKKRGEVHPCLLIENLADDKKTRSFNFAPYFGPFYLTTSDVTRSGATTCTVK